jgi:hypothetical protein
MSSKKISEQKWRDFEDAHDEVLTITKLKDDLFYIRAWKKDGQNFVPALNAIHSISQQASAAKIGNHGSKHEADRISVESVWRRFVKHFPLLKTKNKSHIAHRTS